MRATPPPAAPAAPACCPRTCQVPVKSRMKDESTSVNTSRLEAASSCTASWSSNVPENARNCHLQDCRPAAKGEQREQGLLLGSACQREAVGVEVRPVLAARRLACSSCLAPSTSSVRVLAMLAYTWLPAS
jgi:hypothetical protein